MHCLPALPGLPSQFKAGQRSEPQRTQRSPKLVPRLLLLIVIVIFLCSVEAGTEGP